jgi:chromosome segregation ATPase
MPEVSLISKAKDVFGLLREFIIVMVIGALLVFPSWVSAKLKEAGIVSASIAGIEWRNQLVQAAETNQQAQAQILALEKRLAEVQSSLHALSESARDAQVKQTADTLTQNIEAAAKEATSTRSALNSRIGTQAEFLDRVDPGVVKANPRIFKMERVQ